MRRTALVFFSGFAGGMLFVGILLSWHGQRLRLTQAAVASAPPTPVPPASPSGGVTPTRPPESEANRSAPEIPPPPQLTPEPAAPAVLPSPNVAAAELPSSLLIPVQGITASELRDDFAEMRNGHRHEAIDILAPRGTPVLAAAEGNLVKLFQSKEGGLTVYQFDDSQTWCYYYAHLDRYAKGVTAGTLLRRGDVLGYVGTTGDAPAQTPHLHFAIFRLGPEKHWWQGTAVDPYPLLTGRPNQ